MPETHKAKGRYNNVPESLSQGHTSFLVHEVEGIQEHEHEDEEDTKSEGCHCFLKEEVQL